MSNLLNEFIIENSAFLCLTTLIAGGVFSVANVYVLLPRLGRQPTRTDVFVPVIMCGTMAAVLWAYPAMLSAASQALAPIWPFASGLLLLCWIVSMLLLATGIWLLLSGVRPKAQEAE